MNTLDSRSPEEVFAGVPAQPKRVVKPGTLPSWLFDQDEVWIDPNGYQHRISDLDREMVEFLITYLFSYASRVRTAWAMETKQTFDVEQRAKRWLLTTPGMRALIERLAIINKIEQLREEMYEPGE